MKKRALISVFDKTDIVAFAEELVKRDWEIVSTGGTYNTLKENSVPVIDVTTVTGFPEVMDGRVKTLTPQIHAGILARRNKTEDMATLERLNIGTIDMVVVNLYPFFEKVVDDSIEFDSKVEFIDIGGPTMLRSAAKNFKDVIVLTDTADYQEVLSQLDSGKVSFQLRQRLAGKVFNLTSAYDAAISSFLLEEDFPTYFTSSYRKVSDLRYGENPHQKAAFYADTSGRGALADFQQLGGKELSYNNIKDLDIAWRLACEFTEPFCAALKHNTPCGAAIGDNIYDAYIKAHRCDPISIFGGIVAVNGTVDKKLAEEMNKTFLEIVAAPDFTEEALAEFGKKVNLRVLKMKHKAGSKIQTAMVDGGMLVQTTDDKLFDDVEIVTKENFYDKYKSDSEFGMKVVKYVKSNAVIVVKDGATIGIGGGQVNRIWPTKDAFARAKIVVDNNPELKDLSDAVFVSDAFFPFEDCVEVAFNHGVKMVVQPGGSNNDKRSIDFCDQHEMSMAMTKIRHFMH